MQDIAYTAFDQPDSITQGTKKLKYTYGLSLSRVKSSYYESNTLKETRYYLGDYEIQQIGDTTREIHYVNASTGLVAMVVKENNEYNYYYTSNDHLGSISTVMDEEGEVVAEQSFDAWGRRRNIEDWNVESTNSVPTWLYRGYTGHEMLDSFQLINMNGRLYDPVIARMLSPDPFVQAPNSLQNYNRYSYVMNNPLSYTDPSGYQSKFLSFLGKIFNPDQEGGGAGGGKLVIPDFLSGIAGMITSAWNSTNSGEIGAFEGKNYNSETKSFDKYFQSVGGVRFDADGRPYANFTQIIEFSGITARIGEESDGTSVYQIFNTTVSLTRAYLDNLQPILDPQASLTGSPKTDPSTISNASQVNGIIGFGADMAGFVYRNMDEVVSGAKVLGKVGIGSTVLGAVATAAVIAIEVNNNTANTHSFVDAGVALTSLGMLGLSATLAVTSPVWASGLAIGGSALGLVYGLTTIFGSGPTIDNWSNNWGKNVIDSWKK